MSLTLGISQNCLCRLISQLFFLKDLLRLLRPGRPPSLVLAKSGNADEAKAARVGHDCGGAKNATASVYHPDFAPRPPAAFPMRFNSNSGADIMTAWT